MTTRMKKLPALRLLNNIAIASILVVSVGCGGGSELKLVPVTGTVTVGSSTPLAKATVLFTPKSAGKVGGGTATTDEKGNFVVKHQGQLAGIAAGDYNVSFSLWQLADGSPLPDQSAESEPKSLKQLGAVQFVPPEYASLTESKNSVTVPANGGKFDFNIPELKKPGKIKKLAKR